MDSEQSLSNRFWISFGIGVVILIFGVGGYWSAATKISGAIIANGRIGVESNVKTVQHLEGGVVSEFFVANGDMVTAGDTLLLLDATGIEANVNILRTRIGELLAHRARLETELEGTEAIIFPSEVLERLGAQNGKRLLSRTTAMFDLRNENRRGQIAIMEQEILQLGEQISGLRAQMNSQSQQAKLLEQAIRRKKAAFDQGIVSQDAMDQLQSSHLQVVGRVGELRSAIGSVSSAIAKVRLQIIQVDVKMRESSESELHDVLSKIDELREEERALEERLRRAVVTAPVSGIVHEFGVYTVGSVIPPNGQPIMQIIPQSDPMIVEAKISVSDVDQVHVGQTASVVLSAFDSNRTPILSATVTSISPAPLVDEVSGIPFFEVRLMIPENELALLDGDQKLLLGMPAEVFIQTEERTPLNYLAKPIMDQFFRAFKEQ